MSDNNQEIEEIILRRAQKEARSLLREFIGLPNNGGSTLSLNDELLKIKNFQLKADKLFKSKNNSSTLSYLWWKEYFESVELKNIFTSEIAIGILDALSFISNTVSAKISSLEKNLQEK